MKLTLRNQIILAIVGVIALCAAMLFFLIWPQFQKVGELSDEIKAQDEQIAAARDLLNRRIEARDNAARTSAEYILQTNRVPDSPELPSLIIEIQDAADSSGLILERIAPESATEDLETYTAYQIKLELIGRWADYIDFLRRLEKMTRGVRVVETTIDYYEQPGSAASTQTVETETEVAVTMFIEVYTINADASSTGTATPPPTP